MTALITEKLLPKKPGLSIPVQMKIWVPFWKRVLTKDASLSSTVVPWPQLTASETQVWPGWGQQEEENSGGYGQLSASLENQISSCPWRDFYEFKPLH